MSLISFTFGLISQIEYLIFWSLPVVLPLFRHIYICKFSIYTPKIMFICYIVSINAKYTGDIK